MGAQQERPQQLRKIRESMLRGKVPFEAAASVTQALGLKEQLDSPNTRTIEALSRAEAQRALFFRCEQIARDVSPLVAATIFNRIVVRNDFPTVYRPSLGVTPETVTSPAIRQTEQAITDSQKELTQVKKGQEQLAGYDIVAAATAILSSTGQQTTSQEARSTVDVALLQQRGNRRKRDLATSVNNAPLLPVNRQINAGLHMRARVDALQDQHRHTEAAGLIRDLFTTASALVDKGYRTEAAIIFDKHSEIPGELPTTPEQQERKDHREATLQKVDSYLLPIYDALSPKSRSSS